MESNTGNFSGKKSKFAAVLSQLRKERGSSQKKAAADLGISQALIPLYAKISQMKPKYLVPIVFVLAILGCYATDNSASNAITLLIFGALGVVLRKFRIPLGPFVLGYLIGPSTERALRQTLSMGGNSIGAFFNRPIAIGFYVATVLFIVIIGYTFKKNKETLDKGAHSDDE